MLQPEAFWDRVTSGPLWVETDPGFAGTGTVIVDLVCTECDTRVAEVREHARVPLLVAWEKTPRTLTKQRGRANPGRDPEEGLTHYRFLFPRRDPAATAVGLLCNRRGHHHLCTTLGAVDAAVAEYRKRGKRIRVPIVPVEHTA